MKSVPEMEIGWLERVLARPPHGRAQETDDARTLASSRTTGSPSPTAPASPRASGCPTAPGPVPGDPRIHALPQARRHRARATSRPIRSSPTPACRRPRRHARLGRVRRRDRRRIHAARARRTRCEVIDWIAAPALVERPGRHDGHLLGRLQLPAGRGAAAAGAEGRHLDRLDRRPLQRRHPLQERLPPVSATVVGRDHARLPVAAARPGNRRRPLAGDVAGAARRRALPARGVAGAPAPRRLLAPRLDLRGLRRLRRARARHRRLGRRLPQHAVQGGRRASGRA